MTESLTNEMWARTEFDTSFELESPFAASESEWTASETEADLPTLANLLGESESQFVSPFGSESESSSNHNEVVSELFGDLRDREFEEALDEIVQEASALHAEHSLLFVAEAGGAGSAGAAEAVHEHFAPLVTGAEQLLDQLAMLSGDREAAMLSEAEVETLLESFETAAVPAHESPVFENFFKAIGRLARKVVRKAVDLGRRGLSAVARIIPIGALLNRLKGLIKPLLRRVLKVAINRLPVALRPAAAQLRKRLLRFEDEATVTEAESLAESFESEREHPATAGLEVVHEDFALQLAELLSADNEQIDRFDAEVESEVALGESDQSSAAGELDAARIRLITELSELEEGESAAPAFERFLPALLPALRIGVRVVGRDRVVTFLAKFLAGALKSFVGPKLSRPLSKAIVDAGLRLLTLEAPNSEDERLAGSAMLAAVAEETARAVLANEDEFAADPARLEAETAVAFQEAVARNFPQQFLRADTELETSRTGAGAPVWALRPRAYWYKKYTRVLEVTITPQIAASTTSFSGVSLGAELRASGTGVPVKVRVHLYEALPGCYLSRIAALEKHVPGMGTDGWRRFHPLTVAAATALLGEPGLGRDVAPRFTQNRNMIAAGQRFYYLEVPRQPSERVPGPVVRCSPPSQGFLTLDGRPGRNEVRVAIYVCEPEAQAIASRIRQGNTTAFVVALRTAWTAAMRSIAQGPGGRVQILREATPISEQQVAAAAGGAIAGLGAKIAELIIGKLLDALIRLAVDYAKAKASDFVKAADNPKAGVTVLFTFPAPGVGVALRGGVIGSLASTGLVRTLLAFASGRMTPAMHTLPGLVRG
ncbi:hypothetical protein [Nocardia abscessus]|uniref:hypothetical protein n=1 Tax=Nocardia abscessus TaxID=120957 RepID=UPI002453E15A|nr:hypothetical protein [Nocardia abscessus]